MRPLIMMHSQMSLLGLKLEVLMYSTSSRDGARFVSRQPYMDAALCSPTSQDKRRPKSLDAILDFASLARLHCESSTKATSTTWRLSWTANQRSSRLMSFLAGRLREGHGRMLAS